MTTANRKAPRKSKKISDNVKIAFITAISGIIIAFIGVIGLLLNPQLLDRFADLGKPKCPYQGSIDSITLANLINEEAAAVNKKDVQKIQTLFASTARIRDRVNDQLPSEKKQEWVSPQAYYQDYLFATKTITAAVHSDILPDGATGIGSAEAWRTSASSGYSNGVKYENKPGSDHWRFIKNSQGCWVIAEFDFNASHIQFP